MNKTYLIFKHEFLHTIKRKGFIIMTFIVPLLVLLGIVAGHFLPGDAGPRAVKVKTIGYVDESGQFNFDSPTDYAKLVRFNTRRDANQALAKGQVREYFVITPDFMSTGKINFYSVLKKMEKPFFTRAAIKNFITGNLLEGKVAPGIINIVKSPLNLEFTRLTKTGPAPPEKSRIGSLIISGAFALLLGLSLMINSNYLLQGLGEEKESRLIEVFLSSVSVRQLLTGKVLGLGAAGLSQVLLWLVSAPLILNMAPHSLNTFINSIDLPPYFYALAAVYFILGYLLFAVLSIGIGAICPNAREGQSLAMIYTLLNFVPLWFLSLMLMFPNSPIWVVLSIFPITAPVQTMLRLGFTAVPAWELATSLIVLFLSIIGILYAAIKIFRVHLLMHGKRPGLKEIIKNLKNA